MTAHAELVLYGHKSSFVELLTLPNGYVSGLEGIHIFNNSFFYALVAEEADAHSEQVVDNRNDRYREYSLLSRELLFVQVEPDAPILYLYRGQNGKVATERVVRRNYSEVALPMENPFVGSSPTVQTSNGECPVVMITPAAED